MERGFEGLTIEGIAARAGVAKQTIYRWWKSKVDILYDNLVLDAEDALAWPEPAPGAGYSVDELRGYLHRFAAFLGTEPAGRVLQALLGHAQLDRRTFELLHSGFLGELTARDTERVRECLSGLLPEAGAETTAATGTTGATGAEASALLDALLAPLYYRALLARGPIDPALVDATLDQQLDQHLGPAPARRARTA